MKRRAVLLAMAIVISAQAAAWATTSHYGDQVTLRNGSSDVMIGDGTLGTTSSYSTSESWSYITDASEANSAGYWDIGFVRLSWNRKPSFNIPAISAQPIQCQVGEGTFYSTVAGRENWYNLLTGGLLAPSTVLGDASLTCDAKGSADYRIRYPNGAQECVSFSRAGRVFTFEAPASCGAEVFSYKVKGQTTTETLVTTLDSAPFQISIEVP